MPENFLIYLGIPISLCQIEKETTRTKIQAEMYDTLEGINSRITETEKQINDLEDRMVEITITEQSIEKRMKRNDEDSLRYL